jgi:hypothetical protein
MEQELPERVWVVGKVRPKATHRRPIEAGEGQGLAISHTPRMTPCLQLRFQIGTNTRGALSRQVQALQGLEWYLKTSLRSGLMSDDTVPPFEWVSHIVRYSSECVEYGFCELRLLGFLGSSQRVGSSGKPTSPGTFIVDSSALARVMAGWVSSLL